MITCLQLLHLQLQVTNENNFDVKFDLVSNLYYTVQFVVEDTKHTRNNTFISMLCNVLI